MVKGIVERLNVQSSAGPGAITNNLLSWLIKRDNENHETSLTACITRYMKNHIISGIPGFIRDILCYARGVALKKKKIDVRPIAISPSIIRLIDKLAVANAKSQTRRDAIGLTQMVDTRGGTEIGTMVADHR